LSLKIFSVLILFLSVLGCRKEEEKTINKYRISKSLYPFLFDKGSYWVYKNTNSGILENLAVQSITKDIFAVLPNHPGQGIQSYNEYYTTKYSSSLTDSYEEQFLGYVISRGFYHGGFVFLSSKTIGDKSLNAEITDLLDTLTIENRTFKQVVKMKIIGDQYISDDFNLYYADSVGVIKKEKTKNGTIIETWNLIEFKTVLFQPEVH